MLIKKINAEMLKQEFKEYNRDYYSLEACESMVEWFEEIGETTELDIIGLCCDYTEYTIKEIKDDYEDCYNDAIEETKEYYDIEIEDIEELEKEISENYQDYFNDMIVEKLNYSQYATLLSNGNVLIMG